MKRFIPRPFRNYRAATALMSACIALVAVSALAAGASASPPPNVLLGTASQFAVLAGSQITNTGVTTLTGDSGSTPTSTETGFGACPAATCVSQVGANHTAVDPNDTTTQGARSDLITAYADAAGRTPSTIVTELAGQNLVAGVYKAASGTFGMTGTLTLNGAGNADSVFIFQTDSTLITAASANVSLINGAQACNVYWQVGSAATLGASSTLVGTVMAHDDITVGDSVTVNGRLLAGEQASGLGEVTMIHDTITKPSSCVTQASIDAAALAAQQAASQAAQAAQAAKDASDKAAADAAAATKAADDAKAEAGRVAAQKAAKDAQDAADAAKAAKDAADEAAAKAKAAQVLKTQAAAVKAAQVARAKALLAHKQASKAAKAAKLAKKKAELAKKKATSTFARPHTTHVGLTG
jgi:hypothetical protein